MRWTFTDPMMVVVAIVVIAIIMTVLQRIGAWLEWRKQVARIGETWGQPLRRARQHRPIDARERDTAPNRDAYRIDDATAADLELVRVFHRIDRTLTAIGAQTLYRWLRQPLIDPEAIAERRALIDAVRDEPLRARLVVTGSNMGGKSTFLRATGIAAVLAQSIGLVPAISYRARPLRVASLMNVVDDPIAGVSLFRAEVDRIHALIRHADEPDTHLFLLDETFRGTNPAERIAASEAVLHWLVRNDLVIVATHDRELCDLLDDRFAFAYFTEQVHDGDIVFDYRLRPGILQTTNAIALLERAGYPPALVERARRLAMRK